MAVSLRAQPATTRNLNKGRSWLISAPKSVFSNDDEMLLIFKVHAATLLNYASAFPRGFHAYAGDTYAPHVKPLATKNRDKKQISLCS